MKLFTQYIHAVRKDIDNNNAQHTLTHTHAQSNHFCESHMQKEYAWSFVRGTKD